MQTQHALFILERPLLNNLIILTILTWVPYSLDSFGYSMILRDISPVMEMTAFARGSIDLSTINVCHNSLRARALDYKHACLFPEKILMRSSRPVLEPEEEYEVDGIVPNVVCTCGAVLRDDTFFLYYSGADTVTCVATAEISELIVSLKEVET